MKKAIYLRLHTQRTIIGRVAEWLGRGLQNLVRRFESAPDLRKAGIFAGLFLLMANQPHPIPAIIVSATEISSGTT